jgi:hypothetical protein
MDNILEILIPLIFAAIYFFGNMFSGKSDRDSAPSSGSSHQEKDPDVIERQRKIQEMREIRRKIAQRRSSEGSRAPLDVPSSSPAARQSQPETASYESQIQERLRRIEATEKRAKKLKQQSRINRSNTTFADNLPRIARGSARSTLRDPSAARTAFIYGEILGQPVSQRKTQTIPGLIK